MLSIAGTASNFLHHKLSEAGGAVQVNGAATVITAGSFDAALKAWLKSGSASKQDLKVELTDVYAAGDDEADKADEAYMKAGAGLVSLLEGDGDDIYDDSDDDSVHSGDYAMAKSYKPKEDDVGGKAAAAATYGIEGAAQGDVYAKDGGEDGETYGDETPTYGGAVYSDSSGGAPGGAGGGGPPGSVLASHHVGDASRGEAEKILLGRGWVAEGDTQLSAVPGDFVVRASPPILAALAACAWPWR